MPLHFRCPCGVILNSRDGSAGRAAECPTCGKIIVIPQEAISLALADVMPSDRLAAGEAGPLGHPHSRSGGPRASASEHGEAEDSLRGRAAVSLVTPGQEDPPAPEAATPDAVPEPAPPAETESEALPAPAADEDEIAFAPLPPEVDASDPKEASGKEAVDPGKRPPNWPLSEERVVKGRPTPPVGRDERGTGVKPGEGEQEPEGPEEPEERGREKPALSAAGDRSTQPVETAPLEGEGFAPDEPAEQTEAAPLEGEGFASDGAAEPVKAAPPMGKGFAAHEATEPAKAAPFAGLGFARPRSRPPLARLPESGARRSPTRGGGRPAGGAPVDQEAVTTQERPVTERPWKVAPKIPRSKTAVARKRGHQALEALAAVDGGKAAAKRRTRRVAPKSGGVGRALLIFAAMTVLVGAISLAALLFLPASVIPPKFHERVDSLRSGVRGLGLPVKLLKESGEAGDGTDSEPAERTEEETGE